MSTELRAFRQAVMFFTRLPLRSEAHWQVEDLQKAATYFPLVGWLVGGVGAAAWWIAAQFWPPQIASGISLVATVLLTGAFHEDGLADVCDGFGGGYTKERVLAIMRDSRVGAFGAIGVVMALGLKWQAVAALPPPLTPLALVASHALSRGTAVSLMATLPYVREEESKAKPMATELRGVRLFVALGFAVTPLCLLPWRLAWCLVPVVLMRFLLGRWFTYRIGGYTGDCLGAAQQVSEIVIYLSFLALLR